MNDGVEGNAGFGRGEDTAALMERVLFEVKRVVVGQDHFLERVLVAILAQGHLLVEGVPGLAETLTVNTLAKTVHGSFRRIQFTPDLLPADLVGTRMFNQKSGEFSTVLGPVFCNLLLADEINRAPAKVQSALLEVMRERQVTIAGESHKVPQPFLVMATQNPIETEGTYPLPEVEMAIPDLGLVVMQDAESGEQLLPDTHDKAFRRRFAQVAEAREAALRETLSQLDVDCLELATGEPIDDALLRFVDARKRRSQLAAGSVASRAVRRARVGTATGGAASTPFASGPRTAAAPA